MFLRNFLKSRGQLGLQLLQKQVFPFSKPHKKCRDKYRVDYEYFASIPRHMREDELEKIISLPKSNIQLSKHIPFFPINEYWDYHGTKLMMHFWEPPPNVKARAVVVFFHSLNGHTGMCGELAKELAADGIVVAGYDFKNFGQSEGTNRGMLESFDDLVSVSEQFTIKMKAKYANLKIFMCGMSLGGAIAFNISVKSPKLVDGLILLSPSIRENNLHYPLLKKLTVLLSFVLPNQKLLKSSARNGSKYKLDDYSKKDPYIYHGRLWAKTVQQILFGMARTKRLFKQFSSPYLLVQSGSDKLVDPFACLDLEQASPSQDKTTVIIHGMWHAVWFDDHVYDVIRIIEEWLEERI